MKKTLFLNLLFIHLIFGIQMDNLTESPVIISNMAQNSDSEKNI